MASNHQGDQEEYDEDRLDSMIENTVRLSNHEVTGSNEELLARVGLSMSIGGRSVTMTDDGS